MMKRCNKLRGGNAMQRQHVKSGSPWEQKVGYSRAVRSGNWISVSGTTAVNGNGEIVGVGDMYKQTSYIFQKIRSALIEVGSSMNDIVRTRMFTTDITRWEEIGKAHREIFSEVMPAATLLEVSKLIHHDLLIEIEVDAFLE